MSRISELKRQIEAAAGAIDALDAGLAAGRLGSEEHARRRAEHEREAGRLVVALRQAQREGRERPPAASTAPPVPWFRNPMTVVPVAVLLLIAGVAGGLAVARWSTSMPSAPSTSAPAAPTSGSSAVVPALDLQALRSVAGREDASIPSILEFAHVALDQGSLDEARRAYERVLAREPRNAEAVDHLGAVLFKEGKIDEALAKVDEALRIDPRYVHAHWDRTQYLYSKGDFPGAIKAAEAFLQVVPSGPDAENVRKLMADARQQAGKAR